MEEPLKKKRNIIEANLSVINRDKGERPLWIWGIGKNVEIVEEVLHSHDIRIDGYIDQKALSNMIRNGCPVKSCDEVLKEKPYVIVSIGQFDPSVMEKFREYDYQKTDFFYALYRIWVNTEDTEYRGCKVGRYTYGYKELLEYFPMAESIGRYCSINGSAKIYNNHPLEYVTTSAILDYPDFYPADQYFQRQQYMNEYGTHFHNHPFENSPLRSNEPVVIGNDVWIGANAVILPCVHIGDGAVVAAGAVVTKDVEPYAIVGGVAAKTIRYRFDKEIIDQLLRIRWWDWPHEKIEENIELLYQPNQFVEKFGV